MKSGQPENRERGYPQSRFFASLRIAIPELIWLSTSPNPARAADPGQKETPRSG